MSALKKNNCHPRSGDRHPRSGDHIYIQRYNPINYTHHGIVVSDYPNIKIAHPCLNSQKQAVFRITGLTEFIGDLSNCIDCDILDKKFSTKFNALKNKLSKNPYCIIKIKQYTSSHSRQKIVARAHQFIKNVPDYCLLTQNCEMFAEYCSTGVMPVVCNQVIDTTLQLLDGKNLIKNINNTVVDYLSTYVL
jgi:hypothetical protein